MFEGGKSYICLGQTPYYISYYVNNESNVYGLLLDVSKAFDRVNYCKIFRTLFNRKYVPFTVDSFLICILIKS